MERAKRIEAYCDAFREMSKIVHASIKVEEVLELAVWKASEILGAKGALLRLLNLETQELELSAAYGLSNEYLSKGPVTRSNIINDIYSKKKTIIIDDIATDPRVQYPKEALREGIRMLLELPLTFQDGIAGILGDLSHDRSGWIERTGRQGFRRPPVGPQAARYGRDADTVQHPSVPCLNADHHHDRLCNGPERGGGHEAGGLRLSCQALCG
jgi:hypothetical protein